MTLNDVIYDKLGELGYVGTFNDRFYKFFEDLNQNGPMDIQAQVVMMDAGEPAWCDVVENQEGNSVMLTFYLPEGDAGAQGLAGPPGPAGSAGAKGDVGATGPQGPTGASGAPGATGPKGDQGLQGNNGLQGIQGVQGATGNTGATGPNPLVSLGTVTVAQTAAVAIAAGIRTVAITGVTGLLAGDTIILTPTAALPVGYGFHNAVCVVDGTLQVTLFAPLLAIGASYTIQATVKVLR